MSSVACHHDVGLAHIVGQRQVCHAIIALRRQTWSNDVSRGMPSLPLGSTDSQTTSGVAFNHHLWTSSHSRTASGVACHHHPWTDKKVEHYRAWHAIIAFGQHTRSNDIRRGMPSWPLKNIHSRLTSGVACYHGPWTAHTVEQHRALHSIIALGRQTRSNDVVRGMLSSPLD